MHVPSVLMGLAAVTYGTYTAWARQVRPQQFAKLGAMKEAWGDSGGYAVHVIGYTVVPLVAGLFMLWNGF